MARLHAAGIVPMATAAAISGRAARGIVHRFFGEFRRGSQDYPLARAMPAAEPVAVLAAELDGAR